MDSESSNPLSRATHPHQANSVHVARIVRWLLVIVVVVALGVLLVARVRSANQAIVQSIVAHPGLAPIAVRAGQVAPDFTLTPLNSSPTHAIQLTGLRGRVVVINFWSPSCAPCRDEAPILTHAARQYAGSAVAFVGVTFDGTRDDILTYLRHYHIAYACGLDSTNEIAAAYGLIAIPVTVVVDTRGVVARIIQGAVSAASLGQALQSALKQPG